MREVIFISIITDLNSPPPFKVHLPSLLTKTQI